MNATEKTVEHYKKRLQVLRTKGIRPENRHFNKTLEKIEMFYPNLHSRKSMITSIVGLEKAGHLTIGKNALKRYKDEILSLDTRISGNDRKQKKTPKEEKNWITDECVAKALERIEDKDMDAPTLSSIWNLQKWIVLRLYTVENAPVRNDYYTVDIESPNLLAGFNRYNTETGTLTLEQFKTSKTNPKIEFTVSDTLKSQIAKLIENRKKFKIYSGPLLMNKTLTGRLGGPKLTELLNEIFGKKAASTMLRKYYISKHLPVTPSTTMEKRIEMARQMGNSPSVQHIYSKRD